jgi:hypothetical protein
MEKQLISSGSIFEKEVAFSRAVVVDKMVFVVTITARQQFPTILLSKPSRPSKISNML